MVSKKEHLDDHPSRVSKNSQFCQAGVREIIPGEANSLNKGTEAWKRFLNPEHM